MLGYLTPDSIPADTICRVLFIPNNQEFIANVTGALQVLINPDSWTPYGILTPEESANALVDMFDKFCFAQGTCRVLSEIICLATDVSPDPKWLLCDGSLLLITDYPDLYAIIGTTYGTSPDGLHFAIPDLNGRVIVGSGSTYSPGDKFGEDSHQLVTSEIPSHSHTDAGHAHSEITAVTTLINGGLEAPASSAIPSVGSTGTGFASIQATGGDGAHENRQPSTVLSYFIVALP